jgi:hypothetical protein
MANLFRPTDSTQKSRLVLGIQIRLRPPYPQHNAYVLYYTALAHSPVVAHINHATTCRVRLYKVRDICGGKRILRDHLHAIRHIRWLEPNPAKRVGARELRV